MQDRYDAFMDAVTSISEEDEQDFKAIHLNKPCSKCNCFYCICNLKKVKENE